MDTTEQLTQLQRENRQLADHVNVLNGTIARLEDELKSKHIPERLTFVLGSGESATMDKAGTVNWLKHLFEFYNGQEKDWYDKTYNGERTISWDPSYEKEWLRYRQEAAALAFAIQVISGEELETRK